MASVVFISVGFGIVAALSLYALPMAVKVMQVRALRKQCARAGALVLTYDDGPGTTLTDALLERLEHSGARATFFLIGATAERDPKQVDRLFAAGHEVACHSYDHLHPWKTAPWRSLTDMHRGYQALARWLQPGAMYRPPYGKIMLPTMVSLAWQGSRLAWWTHDSGDTHARLPEARHVVETVEADGGGVVLLHDFERKGEREARHAFVLETTNLLLELARRRNLRVVTMGELARGDNA